MVSKVGKNLQRVNGFQDGDGVKDSSVYLDAHTAVAEVRGRDVGVAAFVVRALSSTNVPTEVFRVDKDGAVSGALAPPGPVGTADAGPAINAALNAACAQGGGVVTLRAGTYRITTQVVIPCDGITLEGAGIGRTILESGATFATGMVRSTARSKLTLRGLTLSTRSADSGYGFYVEGGASAATTDVLVQDVHVEQLGTAANGAVLSGLGGGFQRVTLRNVRVTSPTSQTGNTIGMDIGAGTSPAVSYDLVIDGCTFDGFQDALRNGTTGEWRNVKVANSRFCNAKHHGAYFYHCGEIQVVGCDFTGNDFGCYVDEGAGSQGVTIAACRFRLNTTCGLRGEEWARGCLTGCSFQENGYGLWVMSGLDVAITGCTMVHNTRDGIVIDKGLSLTSLAGNGFVYEITNSTYVQDVTISGCVVAGNSRNGISVRGVQRGFLLVGCTVAQNGQDDNPTPNLYADVDLKADEDTANNYSVRIVGCTIGNLGGSGTDTGYTKTGIKSVTNTLSDLTVEGCRFEGLFRAISVPDVGGFAAVVACTFVTCQNNMILPAAAVWQTNTISGGALVQQTSTADDWIPYAPTWTGFSANPTVTSRYRQVGKTVTWAVIATVNGTSNATTLTATLPVTARAIQIACGLGVGNDNGATLATPVRVDVSSTTVASFYTTPAAGVWTNTGAKAVHFTITYEAA